MDLLNGMLTDSGEGHIGIYKERQDLLVELIEKHKPKTIIETGFNMGHSTLLVCQTLKRMNVSPVRYWVFDICYWHTVRHNFEIIKSHFSDTIRLELVEGDTNQTMRQFTPPDLLDFVIVDGDHSGEGCKNDIDSVITRMSPGGIIYIDDYKSTKYSIGALNIAVDSTDWTGFRTDWIDGVFWAQRI